VARTVGWIGQVYQTHAINARDDTVLIQGGQLIGYPTCLSIPSLKLVEPIFTNVNTIGFSKMQHEFLNIFGTINMDDRLTQDNKRLVRGICANLSKSWLHFSALFGTPETPVSKAANSIGYLERIKRSKPFITPKAIL
jgi:hypothetical protein